MAKHKEGEFTKEIERETAQVPSDIYLWGALSTMGISLTLKCFKEDELSLFVGQWAAPLLIMGVYNKVVKTLGSE